MWNNNNKKEEMKKMNKIYGTSMAIKISNKINIYDGINILLIETKE